MRAEAAKRLPKISKRAEMSLVILAIRFFMIDFPINPILGHTTIISHISILVKTFWGFLRGGRGFCWFFGKIMVR